MMRTEKTSKKGLPLLLVLCITVCAFLFLIVPLNVNDRNKRVSSPEKSPETVKVAMARKALNAGTVLTFDYISTETVSRDELPEGNLVTPLQAVGRVLGLPVVEGQVLTQTCLVPEGTVSILASQIPEGMRVFSVPLTSTVRSDHKHLYPGCVVDVQVAYELNRNARGEAPSTTMFRGLRVLAISGDSVISKPGPEEDDKNKKSSRRYRLLVSLLVEPKQVEALQLAIENSNITLSIRNPLDVYDFDEDQSILNNGTIFLHNPHKPKIGDFPIEWNEIWDKINYWQLLPENHPRRLQLFMSDKLVEN